MTPAEKATQLIRQFDKISDYPVQCAMAAVSEFLSVETPGGWQCAHWKFWNDVKIELERL